MHLVAHQPAALVCGEYAQGVYLQYDDAQTPVVLAHVLDVVSVDVDQSVVLAVVLSVETNTVYNRTCGQRAYSKLRIKIGLKE